MYILNNQEKKLLVIMVKNARIDFFRKNQYLFNEESMEDKEQLYDDHSKEEIDKVEEKSDFEDQTNKFEYIFTEKNIFDIAKTLTYSEKLVLSLYYIEEKNDNEIAEIMFLTRSAVNKKRLKALKKIRDKYEKRRKNNV